MAGKKISCSKCRRTYDNTIEFCPFCTSPNPLFSKSAPGNKDADKPIKSSTVKKVPKKEAVPEPEPEPEIDEYDIDDSYEEQETEYSEEDSSGAEGESYDDSEEAYEEYGEEYTSDDDAEYVDEEDVQFSESYDDLDSEEAASEEDETSHSMLTSNNKRERIDWTDEEPTDTSNNSDMYDENGEYNPNYDHFYDDTKAKIQNELESLASGKEKAILKIVGGVVAVIAVIVYLVLTLY